MSEFVNRFVREKLYVPGTGGSMVLAQYFPPTSPPSPKIIDDSTSEFVDVRRWALNIEYINRDVTGSGAVGGPELVRVGMNWSFAAIIAASYGQFVDVAMGSARGVAMVFNMGDPAWWAARELPAFSYRGRCLLSGIKPVSVSREEVVLEIAGQGSEGTVLWGYLDDVPIPNSLWP